MELRFTVWQFVRLMVHLEDAAKPAAAQRRLYEAWRDVWTPLDRELADLAAGDAEAYSTMMMDQDVVFEDATSDQAAAAAGALEAVMADLDAAIAQEADKAEGPDGDEAFVQSLKFERRELRQLARKLARLGETGNAS